MQTNLSMQPNLEFGMGFGYSYMTPDRAAGPAYDPPRMNIMSTLAPSSTVPGGIPLLTPVQLQVGAPWVVPPPFNGGCVKPPLSQLLMGFRSE